MRMPCRRIWVLTRPYLIIIIAFGTKCISSEIKVPYSLKVFIGSMQNDKMDIRGETVPLRYALDDLI